MFRETPLEANIFKDKDQLLPLSYSAKPQPPHKSSSFTLKASAHGVLDHHKFLIITIS